MAKKVIKEVLDGTIHQVSGQDATFLYAESPTSPMHISTLTIVEGSLKFNDFKEVLASKLHLMPKFRKRLVNVPLNLDYPYWVDDPNFDIDLHLNRIKLPDPSNWSTLRQLTSSVVSRSLDLRRPLWEINFVEGVDEIPQLPKGSVAIITKVHHVMIDGSSGVGLMGILFDKNKEDKDNTLLKPKPFEPEPLPDEISLLLKSSYKFFQSPLEIPKTLGEVALAVVKNKATSKMKGKTAFKKNTYAVPKTIFNGDVSPKRTWGTAILSFERINALRKIMGVSINDLIVAMCAGAIRRYLLGRNKLPSSPLVANVPISIRTKNEAQKMENKISNMLIRIGTHIEDPIERLEYIQEQTEIGKTKHKAVGAKSLMKMAESVPFGLANLAAGMYSRYNIKEFLHPPFNVTITNVPGPNAPLYLKGHKIVSVFGLTPVLDGFGLIIAAFSYNGQVTITTTSDAKTMPDADMFSKYIREAANELEELIVKRGNKKETKERKVVFKSTRFFTAFKKYLKENLKEIKVNGVIEFQVENQHKEDFWEVNITEKDVEVTKKKAINPMVTVKINDQNLAALYKKQLLVEELKIQGRLKYVGTSRNIAKITTLLKHFLSK